MKFIQKTIKAILLSAAMLAAGVPSQTFASTDGVQAIIEEIVQINPTTVELRMKNAQRFTFDFYTKVISFFV